MLFPFFIGCSDSNGEMELVSSEMEVVMNSFAMGDFVARGGLLFGGVSVRRCIVLC